MTYDKWRITPRTYITTTAKQSRQKRTHILWYILYSDVPYRTSPVPHPDVWWCMMMYHTSWCFCISSAHNQFSSFTTGLHKPSMPYQYWTCVLLAVIWNMKVVLIFYNWVGKLKWLAHLVHKNILPDPKPKSGIMHYIFWNNRISSHLNWAISDKWNICELIWVALISK